MPLVPIFPWSLTDTYPAGSEDWSGTTVAVAPAGTWLTPDVPLPAQNLNWLFGNISASVGALQNFATGAYVMNWRTAVAEGTFDSGSPDFGGAACWGYADNRWMVTTLHQASTSSWSAWVSQGNDGAAAAGWTQLGSAVTRVSAAVLYMDAVSDPQTTGYYWVFIVDASSKDVFPFQYAGSSWAAAGSTITPTYVSSGSPTGIAACAFNTYAIFALSSTAGDNIGLASTANNGSTWSFFTTGLPVFASGGRWLLKCNTSPNQGAGGTNMVLAIPQSAAGGPATKVFKSTDGITWTLATTLAFMASGASVTGLAWGQDAQGPCWIMTTTLAGVSKVYRSGDGAGWTLQRTNVVGFNICDLAANGLCLVASVLEATAGAKSTAIGSVDGGVTWFVLSETLFASENSGSFTGYTIPRVLGSGERFLTWNNLWLRFSDAGGEPSTF